MECFEFIDTNLCVCLKLSLNLIKMYSLPIARETLPLAGLSVLDAGIGHYPQWEAPSAVLNEYFKVLDKLGV